MSTETQAPIQTEDVFLHPDHSVTDEKDEPIGNWWGITERTTQITHYSISIFGGPAFIVSMTPDGQQIQRPVQASC